MGSISGVLFPNVVHYVLEALVSSTSRSHPGISCSCKCRPRKTREIWTELQGSLVALPVGGRSPGKPSWSDAALRFFQESYVTLPVEQGSVHNLREFLGENYNFSSLVIFNSPRRADNNCVGFTFSMKSRYLRAESKATLAQILMPVILPLFGDVERISNADRATLDESARSVSCRFSCARMSRRCL